MKKIMLIVPFLINAFADCAPKQIEVTVKANPSTGYSWQYTCDPESGATVEKIENNKAISKKTSKPLIGAPLEETYRVTKKGKKTVTCSFSYSRPWEKDVPPVQQFAVTL